MRITFLTLLFILLNIIIITAQDETTGFGEWTLVDIDSATLFGETRQMVISPDGRQFAYNDSINIDLCVFSLEGRFNDLHRLS